ncbi:glycosyltransferase family 8 protein [Xylaria palmicola]|nr:glycosyltransferase family 8 protein [Xylaria palmicola]
MAQQGGGEDVYATLLLTDTYLPGALVLAHSLRDAATTKKLAALVTLDSVSAEAITELKSVYHYVIPVPRIRNAHPANLQLMNRTDLHSAFTKINLWSQTQFRKIVYIDSDVVAYRAPDELFSIQHPFSAAPDIGWPDLFNTGVMVLTPNMGDYYAMMAMAERGISFDGADQGLINTHFRNNYNRISFTYNVTPSAHYQYIPAYRHFQSSINMVHFIGSDKPWFQGRHASTGSSPFDEMTGRWWAVYDHHYRVVAPQPASSVPAQAPGTVTAAKPVPELVQYLTKGEYQPRSSHVGSFNNGHGDEHRGHRKLDEATTLSEAQRHHHPDAAGSIVHSESYQQHPHDHVQEEPPLGVSTQKPEPSSFISSDMISAFRDDEDTQAKDDEEQIHAQGLPVPPPQPEQKPQPFQPSMSSWDAQRHPPPPQSKPEAADFPSTIYEMSKTTTPFIPPRQYPSPPKGMWYEVPKEAPADPSKPLQPIFPWEAHRPKPSRVFVDVERRVSVSTETRDLEASSGEPQPMLDAQQSVETSAEETEQQSGPVTPTTPTIEISGVDPWTSYSRTNAWDEVPEIERYVGFMQKRQRSRSGRFPGVIALPGSSDGVDSATWQRRGSRVTDFPDEIERPSLPVTPAPIRPSKFWGSDSGASQGDNKPPLPSAEGVPGQSDWDPVTQLQKLARQQSEELLKRLGGSSPDGGSLSPRLSPSGSEVLTVPTYVTQSTQLLSPQPVKGSAGSSPVVNLAADLEMRPRTAPMPTGTATTPSASAPTSGGSTCS